MALRTAARRAAASMARGPTTACTRAWAAALAPQAESWLQSAYPGARMVARGEHPAAGSGARRGARWSVEREPHHEIVPATDIVNEESIHAALDKTREAAKDPERIREILQIARDRALLTRAGSPARRAAACGAALEEDDDLKSEYVQGLSLEEAATLLNVDSSDHELMDELFRTALFIKERIYGNRIVLFAPLYLSNYCVNGCTYCAYRGENKTIKRDKVSHADLVSEVKALQEQGHRRLLVLTGEHPEYSFDDFLEALQLIAKTESEPHGAIRRINVEIPALSVSDLRRLKATDVVGTYTLFQETYHRESFAKFHPPGTGPKSDYDNRLQVMDRAQIAGIDDVGIGALFGLYDYRFEVLALLQHGEHLEKTYNAGPHTISIPRIRPADNAPDAAQPPMPVSDDDFRKLVAVIRCAVPYTGMILSTRESPQMRKELLHLGVSQMSAGSKTDVHAYTKGEIGAEQDMLARAAGLETGGAGALEDTPPCAADSALSRLVAEAHAKKLAADERAAEASAAVVAGGDAAAHAKKPTRRTRPAANATAAVGTRKGKHVQRIEENKQKRKAAAAAAADHDAGQFELLDHRNLDEVVGDLMADGFVPSFCTACYRKGRTGEQFMKIAKKGDIKNFCHPNSLLTLQEFLDDYASEGVAKLGEEVVAHETETITNPGALRLLGRKMKRVKLGERDLYF